MSEKRQFHRPFDELKKLVGIDDVAYELGFKFDPKEGRGKYITLRRDNGRGQNEAIRIANPKDKGNQVYFSERNQVKAGTVISFIIEHEMEFPDRGIDKWDTAGKVMERLASVPQEQRIAGNVAQSYINTKPFDPSEYAVQNVSKDIYGSLNFFSQRRISRETVELFADNIVRIKDLTSRVQYNNIGFPYRTPGSDKVEGYEIRGYETADGKKFKSKARGTNSTRALWCTDFTNGHPEEVKHVFFAESAYDIMAFVQANRQMIDLQHAAFASMGGNFNNQQVLVTVAHYSNAIPVDCFDNDINGQLYGCRMALLTDNKQFNIVRLKDEQKTQFTIDGKTFIIPDDKLSLQALKKHVHLTREAQAVKPPKDYKDWNDYILHKPYRLIKETKSAWEVRQNLAEKRTKNINTNKL